MISAIVRVAAIMACVAVSCGSNKSSGGDSSCRADSCKDVKPGDIPSLDLKYPKDATDTTGESETPPPDEQAVDAPDTPPPPDGEDVANDLETPPQPFQVVAVGDFTCAPWGAAVWKDRIYVGCVVENADIPLFRTAPGGDQPEFVRNLGTGGGMPRLFVSPDGNWLHALTNGMSGNAETEGRHWWTGDSDAASSWLDEKFGNSSDTRWGLAATTYQAVMYVAMSGPYGPARVLKYTGKWTTMGPAVTPDTALEIAELIGFKGQVYAGGCKTNQYDKPDSAAIVRYDDFTNKWDAVFPQAGKDGMIVSSAVFEGKAWVGTAFGANVYSSPNGIEWTKEHDCGITGSRPAAESMLVVGNRLYLGCADGDGKVRLFDRPPGGAFEEVYSSDLYKSLGDMVVRGGALYIPVARNAGGGALLRASGTP